MKNTIWLLKRVIFLYMTNFVPDFISGTISHSILYFSTKWLAENILMWMYIILFTPYNILWTLDWLVHKLPFGSELFGIMCLFLTLNRKSLIFCLQVELLIFIKFLLLLDESQEFFINGRTFALLSSFSEILATYIGESWTHYLCLELTILYKKTNKITKNRKRIGG